MSWIRNTALDNAKTDNTPTVIDNTLWPFNWNSFTLLLDYLFFSNTPSVSYIIVPSKWSHLMWNNRIHCRCSPSLKVHKHEIFLNFFYPKSNPYMPLVNFRKKICLVSFDFRRNFEVRTFTRWLSICGTKFFLRDIKKIFFPKSSLWSY